MNTRAVLLTFRLNHPPPSSFLSTKLPPSPSTIVFHVESVQIFANDDLKSLFKNVLQSVLSNRLRQAHDRQVLSLVGVEIPRQTQRVGCATRRVEGTTAKQNLQLIVATVSSRTRRPHHRSVTHLSALKGLVID